MKFQRSRVRNLLIFVIEVFCLVGFPCVATCISFLRGKFNMLYVLSYCLPFLTCCARYIQIGSCVLVIMTRFEKLNEKLSEIDIKNHKTELDLSHIRSIQSMLFAEDFKHFTKKESLNTFKKLILMRQMYGKLNSMSLKVNYSFGLSCVIMIANDFVSLTANSYFIFISLTSSPFLFDNFLHVIQIFFWLLPHLMNVVAICAICHLTVNVVSIKKLTMNKI